MKKLILMAAFAGLLGSNVVANTLGDDKDKKKGAAASGSKFNMSSNTKTAGKSQTTGGNSAANRSRGAQRGS